MTDWADRQRDWLSVEGLPGYAPELNPTEQAWGGLKSQELANLCAHTIDTIAHCAMTDWSASTTTLSRAARSAAIALAHTTAERGRPVEAPGSRRLHTPGLPPVHRNSSNCAVLALVLKGALRWRFLGRVIHQLELPVRSVLLCQFKAFALRLATLNGVVHVDVPQVSLLL
jgi:hypothetical protein